MWSGVIGWERIKMGDGCTMSVGWIAVIVVGNNNQREERSCGTKSHLTTFAVGDVRWDQRAHHPGDENIICLFLATVRSGYSSTHLLIYNHSTVTARLASIPSPNALTTPALRNHLPLSTLHQSYLSIHRPRWWLSTTAAHRGQFQD